MNGAKKSRQPLSWRFYRKLHPLGAALFVGVVTYGGVFLIRGFVEKDLYWSKFKTFLPGDLFLMGYAFCMGRVIQANEFKQDTWDSSPIFQTLVLLAGFVYSGVMHFLALYGSNQLLREFAERASQWYHNLGVFGLVFFLVVAVIPVLFRAKGPIWARIGALICLFCYIRCALADIGNQNANPFGR